MGTTITLMDKIYLQFDSPSNFMDVLLDILVAVKLQQLNIELLWKAYGAAGPPVESIAQLRESNLRLANSMEQVAAVLATRNNLPD